MSTTHPERTWTGPGAPERLAILRRTRSIAIVGASDKPARASYFVATYLLSSTTYDVYFVNPGLAAAGKEILGHRVYASLDDLPVTPDLVEVFRKSSDAPRWWRTPPAWAPGPCGCSWASGTRTPRVRPRPRAWRS